MARIPQGNFGQAIARPAPQVNMAAGDPIGGCEVSAAAFAHMLHALSAVAPTALLLEGGYNLDATAAAVEASSSKNASS